ncbi:alpha/beta hydrolase fold protein [Candidatus Protofrankia datiscae]|uniref:Alpha/beta hydrolase fold protein n=1 Tax=Candidatus Protofrankia datiscae TaxID=2716812 RepID=F8AXR6_9ACTN|nr:alpha/beta hydrolase fold protein [Candidatus Protofrankia datiscae]
MQNDPRSISSAGDAPDRAGAATDTDIPVTVRIPADGIELVGDAYGNPAAAPVLLLHGGGQTRHSWGTTARMLARDGWYALAIDLRGHGDSGWSPDGIYPLGRFAADVVAAVRWTGRVPVLIGASLGGIASLAALRQHPDLAAGVVLVDVSPFLQAAGTNRIREFMTARPEGYSSLDEVADAVAAYLPNRPRPRNISGLRKNLRRVDGRWFWHWDPAFLRDTSSQLSQREHVITSGLAEAAASLRIPTLLVRGGQSDVLSVDDARRFLELVPHAEYADVAGAHHMVTGDDNSVFDQAVRDFFDRRVRPRQRLGLDTAPPSL